MHGYKLHMRTENRLIGCRKAEEAVALRGYARTTSFCWMGVNDPHFRVLPVLLPLIADENRVSPGPESKLLFQHAYVWRCARYADLQRRGEQAASRDAVAL